MPCSQFAVCTVLVKGVRKRPYYCVLRSGCSGETKDGLHYQLLVASCAVSATQQGQTGVRRNTRSGLKCTIWKKAGHVKHSFSFKFGRVCPGDWRYLGELANTKQKEKGCTQPDRGKTENSLRISWHQ